MSTCPGQDHRKLTVCDVTCPGCGRQVEMFSDELRLRCPYCRTMVVQEQMPSCIQWCQAARDCVGPKMYDELMGGKGAVPAGGESAPKTTLTRMLGEEHKLILRALEVAQAEVDGLQDSGPVRPRRLEKLVEFFRQFADRFHHAKEEDILFERMKRRGMPVAGSPIGVMLAEHEDFRKRVLAISGAIAPAAGGDAAARESIVKNLLAYLQGLRAHIQKEDGVLYPMAAGMLDESDRRELEREFASAEARFGEGFFERQRRLVVELARN